MAVWLPISCNSDFDTHKFKKKKKKPGWWFGTFLFFHILGTIIPTDYIICFNMVKTTNQIIIMWLIIGIMKGVCFFFGYKTH